jgi:indole-3-glycerol phosphate synthase
VTAGDSDFLAGMARTSAARVATARAAEPEPRLRARAAAKAPAPRLRLSAAGFDLIAELKLRSPVHGPLGAAGDDLEGRVAAYARAGAAIVSVLTEPERFDGTLEHLARASAALEKPGVPAMRKDFLVDPYQLIEARASGAGGALLIIRMLKASQLAELLACASEQGLFVLLECFDAADVAIATGIAGSWRGEPSQCLIGINCRDLGTLAVVPQRLEALAAALPAQHPRVAESGLATPDDAARLARAGYTLALVGSALMSAPDPERLAREMIASGRGAAASRASAAAGGRR